VLQEKRISCDNSNNDVLFKVREILFLCAQGTPDTFLFSLNAHSTGFVASFVTQFRRVLNNNSPKEFSRIAVFPVHENIGVLLHQ